MHYSAPSPPPSSSPPSSLPPPGPRYQQAVAAGPFGHEFRGVEIGQIFHGFDKEWRNIETAATGITRKVTRGLVGKPVGAARQWMGDLYQAEDQLFKLVIFSDMLDKGASTQEAVAEAEKYIFNYRDIPPWVRTVKTTVLPFATYTYKAIPVLTEVAMTRPWKLAKWAGFFWGAHLVAAAMLFGDEADDERRRLSALAYDFMKGLSTFGTPKHTLLPHFRDGMPSFLDTSRRFPMADIFDWHNQAGGVAIPQFLVPNNPVITLGMGLLMNLDTWTGARIGNGVVDDGFAMQLGP